MDPLSARLVESAVVYPTIRVASHPGKLLMGVYGEDGAYVEGTVLDRRSGERGAQVPRELFPDVTDAEVPEAIYAGPLYYHFGHFLLESLARLWYAAQHPDVPLVWAGQHNWQDLELRPWQREILDILGLGNPTSVLVAPTRYARLHLPDIGYRYDDWIHPEHAAFLGRYAPAAPVPGRRLWLSRGQIAKDVRDLNSGPTERRLRQAGWTVVHPETLSVREQLEHLARAEVVAGEEGSAFHALILLADVAGKKLHVLRRHGVEHANMHTVGDALGLDQTFHTLEQERVLSAEGREVSKISPGSSEVLDLLGVPVPAPGGAAPAAEDVLLARVLTALAPERLLVVGDRAPDLVAGATAEVRVAVSPRFDYDPRTYAAPGLDCYELDLKRYVELFHGDRARFDAIRVTGDGYEEVMASIRASRRVSQQSTTWILGTGEVAARAALAVELTQPGLAVRRLFLRGRTVYLLVQLADEPRNESGVAALSMEEVRRRLRWTRPTTLARLQPREEPAPS